MREITKKIIVLTPVKNEAWILHRFLKVCSTFADHIIIADQYSTDGSLDIYAQYPKVIFIQNKNSDYSEKDRQILLINTARNLFGSNNILLAIDADEILAGNAMQTRDWKCMLEAKAGTILYFEKPTLYKSTKLAIRYLNGGWPLGYVDDGSSHTPSFIHSTRIPTPEYASKLYLNEIKFLHYNLIRLDAQASKQRLYSVLENVKNTQSWRLRRRLYNSNLDFSSEGDLHEPSKKEWFEKWEKQGIDMHTISKSKYYWYDYEVLKMFKKYGVRKFYWDDIWTFDWEEFRKFGIEEQFPNLPERPINPPNLLLRNISKWLFKCLDWPMIRIKKILKNLEFNFGM
jgi:hypothetical protein